jgi:hypothetical protein
MNAMLLPIVALLALVPQPQSAAAADPTLLLPPTAHVRYTVQGRGVQVYQCTAQAGSFAWVYQSPEAVLLDPATKQQVGTHSAGPTWTWSDGSSITGSVLQKSPSPDAASIPWLLLATKPAGSTSGALSSIAFVRRSDTQAGAAPAAGCDAKAAAEATILRVPYVATYTFYTAAQ